MNLCWFFGHEYYELVRFSSHARKLGCLKCPKQFAMNDDVQALLPWDADFEKLYYGDILETKS